MICSYFSIIASWKTTLTWKEASKLNLRGIYIFYNQCQCYIVVYDNSYEGISVTANDMTSWEMLQLAWSYRHIIRAWLTCTSGAGCTRYSGPPSAHEKSRNLLVAKRPCKNSLKTNELILYDTGNVEFYFSYANHRVNETDVTLLVSWGRGEVIGGEGRWLGMVIGDERRSVWRWSNFFCIEMCTDIANKYYLMIKKIIEQINA